MPACTEARRGSEGIRRGAGEWFALGIIGALALGPAAWGQDAPPPVEDATAEQPADELRPPDEPELDDGELDAEHMDEQDDLAPFMDPLGAEADLLLFQDIPVVVSAGRRAQTIQQTSVPVSVLDADDVHFSGLTTIPDILPFLPGMDVLRVDRNRHVIGVRGLSDVFTSRTLTLVDGRIAENPIFGGVEFDRLPVMMEDIERIEVVRGPAGAAWGANAANGVINVITRKPNETPQGLLLSNTLNEYGDTSNFVRWAASHGDIAWRTSFEYRQHDSSDDAISGAAFNADDWIRSFRYDVQGVYTLSSDAELSFGVGGSHNEDGAFEFLGEAPISNRETDMTRLFAKYDRETDFGSFFVQWYGTYWRTDDPNVQTSIVVENALNGQVDIDLDRHQLSIGGDVRVNYFRVGRDRPTDIGFGESVVHEQWVGLFVSDRWEATERITLEGQIRGDWYSETQTDWSGRATALFALDESQRHVLRLSGAKAFRAPLLAPRDLEFQAIQAAPGVFIFNGIAADDLKNEQIWSLEAGYTAALTDHFTLRADGYYHRYSDLIGYRTTTMDLGGGVESFLFQPDNIDGADAWGAEIELTANIPRGRFSAWYAYNDLSTDQRDQSIRAFKPATHKVGARARFAITDWLTAVANYRWTDLTRAETQTTPSVPASHRLDLSLTASVFDGRGELLLGVSDVFDETEQAIFGVSNLTAHETPGRTFFVRMQLRF